ncbi:helix-turn-helix domain-containing protein [Coralliovum pocilloporae]|uniref:helix-turn-helix domain-containing protein n=1 Tax=Coralliovum pocilloporae TaxID=3066369 RepID=UPI003307C0A2
MANEKIFAGAKVRAIRAGEQLTQAQFAEKLGVSASYLSQVESNQRPLTAAILLALTRAFDIPIDHLSADETDQITAHLQEACNDPLVAGGGDIGLQEMKTASQTAPNLSRAFIKMHVAYKQLHEKVRDIDDALADPLPDETLLPYEEVRDFFVFSNNYIDEIDRTAEQLVHDQDLHGANKFGRFADYLAAHHGIDVEIALESHKPDFMWRLDRTKDRLTLSANLDGPSRTFVLAHNIALLVGGDLFTSTLKGAGFRTEEAAAICRRALANYFAGAMILPYKAFLEASRSTRHDLDRLCYTFEASMEQVCHRLSTLQRPGARGVPLFFVKIDRAGNIIKRHSSTRFQFARFGSACPLWNVYQAFETPDRFVFQTAEMPDGIRYFNIARAFTKHGVDWAAPERRYAIAVGCEVTHADKFVYADRMDFDNHARVTRIGVSCRICERLDCPSRAVPPIGKRFRVDESSRDIVPFRLPE